MLLIGVTVCRVLPPRRGSYKSRNILAPWPVELGPTLGSGGVRLRVLAAELGLPVDTRGGD